MRLNDFSYYKQLQTNDLEKLITSNLSINILLSFCILCYLGIIVRLWFSLLLVSGILFGKWIGTLVSVLSISTGALILYIIANFFFKDLVKNLLEKKFNKYIHYLKNEFYYLFFYI